MAVFRIGAMLIGAAIGLASGAAAAESGGAAALPRGDFDAHWRQVDGPWRSQVEHTTVQGCRYPAVDACGKPAGGPFPEGATTNYNAFGCRRPAITLRCVVERRGLGGGVAPAAPIAGLPSAGGLAGGRWTLQSGPFTADVDLTVEGARFSGVSDWHMPSSRRDRIVGGLVSGRSIAFTRLCGGRATCVQHYVGTVVGDRASGLWTGSGTRKPVSWTMIRR